MSDLIVIGFDEPQKADQVLHELVQLQKEHLVALEDAVVVIKNAEGKVNIKQSFNLTAAGAVQGGIWGSLVGLIFLNPLLGAAVGAGAGALSGALTDIGINDEFIKELGGTINNNSSALFILLHQFTPDKVIDELKPYGGTILNTSLSVSDEAELKRMLETAQADLSASEDGEGEA